MNNFVRKVGVFPLEKVRQHKKFFIVNKIRRRVEKIRSCIILKDAIAINFVANEHHSFITFVLTFSVVVVDLPTDCILSFLFLAETDVLVPVFSQSTDVVVVNFVVVLKFPNRGGEGGGKDDDNASENVGKKMNLRSFKVHRVYLDPLNMSNARDFSWS